MKIAIFKSESDSFERYTKLLQENGIDIELIPSIEFNFKNLDYPTAKLNAASSYSGIVFTSPRCVEAVRRCSIQLEPWKSKINFSVGETTYSLALKELQLETVGRESGNALKLGQLIAEKYKPELPILFPCGNLKQDTLQKVLEEHQISIEPVEVYETVEHSELSTKLLNVIEQENIEYLVFFSPSGVNFCYDILVKHDKNFNQKKLISIGPSTTKALESKGLAVTGTASTPSPEGLLEVLQNETKSVKRAKFS